MRLTLALAIACATTPALAGATDWVEFAPDTRVRLITSDTLGADGKTLAAIELDMPANTKTYWRVPGETGIPTELDLDGSSGIAGQQFLWPLPRVEEQGGYTDFVYYGPLVVPLELAVAGESPVIEADLLMGICSDICVPATASFSLPLDFASPDAGQGIRIAQALANVPLPWDGAGQPVGEIAWDEASGALQVPIDPALVDPGSLIVDGSGTSHLFGAPQKSQQAGLLSVPLIGGDAAAGLVGQPVTLLFMSPSGPFAVARTVKASTPGPS
jgi:DsbC/DsbD-like thiol-disulfide interchange protein